MVKTIRILTWVALLAGVNMGSYAQPVEPVLNVGSLTAQKIIHLDHSWRFHPGDNPAWAKPELDDHQWAPIDPTKDIRELPQLQRAGISWLRLHLKTGPDLPPVLLYMFQSVASEVYLDGRLLYHFGTISPNPDSVRAYNPYAAFSVPLRPATEHVLALRIGYQPDLDYSRSYLGRLPSAVRYDLYPGADVPAIPLFNIESVYLDAFKIGLSFILFLLHLSLFLSYRQQRANLYAAGMYLLMGLQCWLRAAYDLMHSVDARQILHYYLLLSPMIQGLMVLIFYTLFGLRKGGWFWFTIGAISVGAAHVPANYPWLSEALSYYMPLELIRIAVIARKQNLLGARLVTAGVLINGGLLTIVYLVMKVYQLPVNENEWFFHLLFNGAFLCIPLTLSLRLSLEHGWINRQLNLKLVEVNELSTRNLAHQTYQQQLLAEQNEKLEQQVAERTKELSQQATQLKALDEAKSRFVTNLTHEFRTPLTLIISPVEKLLESPTLSTTVQASLQTVDRNARHLLNQVNQLLEIARTENGQMSLSLSPVKPGWLTTQLVDLFRSPAEANQIDLTLTIQGNDIPYLMDRDKWYKLVYNLLANALKFTPTGGQVQVVLRLENHLLQLSVADTGIGIAPDKVPFIFDRFYQADDHPTRSFEGTGVGLALVRELANLLGGRVEVASQPDQGSTFTVQLPLQAAPLAEQDLTNVPPLPVALLPTQTLEPAIEKDPVLSDLEDDRPLLLLAEDNRELCDFMANELAGTYRVIIARNGEQAWELTRQHLPDLVISDVMMPVQAGVQIDGFQLVNLIRNHPATDHIAVVLLTARSTQTDRLHGLREGADEYLVKPFSLVELRLRLVNLMTRRQKLQTYHRHQLSQLIPEGTTVWEATNDLFLTRIYSLLESHLDNPEVNVDWLASQLAMDRKTLYRKLKSKLQLAPNALIRLYRLRRAGELLRAGRTVTETAYLVGFDSLTYFGHCFKEHYQMTPSEFISQLV